MYTGFFLFFLFAHSLILQFLRLNKPLLLFYCLYLRIQIIIIIVAIITITRILALIKIVFLFLFFFFKQLFTTTVNSGAQSIYFFLAVLLILIFNKTFLTKNMQTAFSVVWWIIIFVLLKNAYVCVCGSKYQATIIVHVCISLFEVNFNVKNANKNRLKLISYLTQLICCFDLGHLLFLLWLLLICLTGKKT